MFSMAVIVVYLSFLPSIDIFFKTRASGNSHLSEFILYCSYTIEESITPSRERPMILDISFAVPNILARHSASLSGCHAASIARSWLPRDRMTPRSARSGLIFLPALLSPGIFSRTDLHNLPNAVACCTMLFPETADFGLSFSFRIMHRYAFSKASRSWRTDLTQNTSCCLSLCSNKHRRMSASMSPSDSALV